MPLTGALSGGRHYLYMRSEKRIVTVVTTRMILFGLLHNRDRFSRRCGSEAGPEVTYPSLTRTRGGARNEGRGAVATAALERPAGPWLRIETAFAWRASRPGRLSRPFVPETLARKIQGGLKLGTLSHRRDALLKRLFAQVGLEAGESLGNEKSRPLPTRRGRPDSAIQV